MRLQMSAASGRQSRESSAYDHYDLSDEQIFAVSAGRSVGGGTQVALERSASRRGHAEAIDVTSIDRNGEAVLTGIMSQGVEFIASDVYQKHLLQLQRSRMKEKPDAV